MIVHCNNKFRPEVIWFLNDNDCFTNRRLEIGICPICEHNLARLVETRITDNKIFDSIYSRRKANRKINELECEVSYTSLDSLPRGRSLYGWRYGENKEKIDKDGNTIVIQKSVDFYGNKEEIFKGHCVNSITRGAN